MELKKTAVAGTMESSDIMITVEPRESGGIALELTSSVMKQYGRRIEQVIRETAAELGVEHALIRAVDKGALDCTVRARAAAALFRAAESENGVWEVGK